MAVKGHRLSDFLKFLARTVIWCHRYSIFQCRCLVFYFHLYTIPKDSSIEVMSMNIYFVIRISPKSVHRHISVCVNTSIKRRRHEIYVHRAFYISHLDPQHAKQVFLNFLEGVLFEYCFLCIKMGLIVHKFGERGTWGLALWLSLISAKCTNTDDQCQSCVVTDKSKCSKCKDDLFVHDKTGKCTGMLRYSVNTLPTHIYIYIQFISVEIISVVTVFIMSTMASQITSLTNVYSTVFQGADQRKHQSSTSLAFVRGIHRCPVNSSHKGPVTQKHIVPFYSP